MTDLIGRAASDVIIYKCHSCLLFDSAERTINILAVLFLFSPNFLKVNNVSILITTHTFKVFATWLFLFLDDDI